MKTLTKKQDMMVIDDFIGSTTGIPSKYESDYHPVVGQKEIVILVKTDSDITVTLHEGISEIDPSTSNSIAQSTTTVLAGNSAKIIETIAGKWLMISIESLIGVANIELFSTARAF